MNRLVAFSRTMVVVLGAAAFLMMAAGCGGGGGPEDTVDAVDQDVPGDVTGDLAVPDTTDTNERDTVGETGEDATDDVTDDGDATDVEQDVPTDIPGVDIINPDEIFQPIQDQEFAQEFNHTGIEIDRRITDIVDIAVKPAGAEAGLDAFDQPTLLGSDGFWVRGVSGTDPKPVADPVKVAVDPANGAIVAGAFTNSSLFIIQEKAVSEVKIDGEGVMSLLPKMSLMEGSYKTFDSYGWTLFTDGNTIGAVTPDKGLIAVTNLALNIAIRSLATNKTHTLLYLAGLTGEDDRLQVRELKEDGSLGDLLHSCLAPFSGITRMIADVSVPTDLELVVVGSDGIAGFASIAQDGQLPAEIPEFAAGRVPLKGATDIAKTADGGFIVTTNGGAMRMIDRGDGPEWRFYNTLRWVADNDVRAVATTPDVPDSPIYFGSAAGMTWTTVERMTLEDKMTLLREKIELRHDRDGAVADSRLTVPGDLSTNIPWDSDNDGGWTSYWLIAECMRWKETNDPQAKANFDHSLQAMLNLRLLTGTDWFLARALIRKDGCQLDDCDDPDDGLWYTSPDGEWWVKSDTSNDEVTSHLFMMGPAYDLCADETQKKAIAAHVSNIIGGIIDHGYQLLRPTGECTTYGQFDPEYVNFFGLFGDGGQRSAQMLAGINLAIYMTEDQESKLAQGETLDMPGSQKFRNAKAFLMNDENHYDDNVVVSTEPPGRHGNGDGDELSTQAFFILVQYEDDPAQKGVWLDGWNRLYYYLNMNQSAVWDVIHGVIGGHGPDMYLGERWFRLYPLDLIRWNIHNIHRLDLVKAPQFYIDQPQFAERYMRSDDRILPPDERPNDRHNTSQFQIEGGWGANVEMDAGDVLAAYWMARYYNFIEPVAEPGKALF